MPAEIYEGRLLYGTTPSTSYTAASAAGWNPGTAHLLQCWADRTKLKLPGIRKKHSAKRYGGTQGFVAGREDSELALSMYVGLAPATPSLLPPLEATLLSHVWGGISNPPTARFFNAGGGTHTTTKVYVAAHDITAGMGVLINGEARRVASVDSTYINLEMALKAAPADGDDVTVANTVYFDPAAAINVWDLLLMGLHAEDQIQTLACMGPAAFGGLMQDQPVDLTFNLAVPHWREVPATDREAAPLSYTATPEGTGSGPTPGSGAVYLGDWASTTRGVCECDEVKVDPGIGFHQVKSGGNFVGYKRTRSIAKVGFKRYIADDYASHAAFTAQTAKQILIQCGNVAGGTFWISVPRCVLTEKPTRTTIGDMEALEQSFEATEPTVAASPVELYSTMISANWA